MGVAHLLDVEGAHPTLASIGPHQPLLAPEAVRLFATDNVTRPEQAVIERLDLQVEPLAAVVDDLAAVAARTRAWARDFDRILVHVDVDVLDFESFPIAENTGRRGGLDLNGLQRLLTMLCSLPNWQALTLSEINPAHAPDEEQSFAQLIDVLGEVLTGSDHDAPS